MSILLYEIRIGPYTGTTGSLRDQKYYALEDILRLDLSDEMYHQWQPASGDCLKALAEADMMHSQGYTHIYTGNGKGKTTAALGLVLRAAGAGMKCLIIQFMKGREFSELHSLSMLHDLVAVEQYGSKDFCMPGKNRDEHREFAREGYERAASALKTGDYSLVVLDEIITAMNAGLIGEEDLIGLIKLKRPESELVLTGRGATEGLIGCADLVTEMVDVKHYYSRGIRARRGIEE